MPLACVGEWTYVGRLVETMVAPTIVQTATAVPAHILDQDSVKRALCELLPLPPRKLEAAMALFDHALVERRHSVLPIHQLRARRTLTATTQVYREHAVQLARTVSQRCLADAGVSAQDIDLVISVSCTGVMIPSLDAHLANDLPLRPDIRRMPITELGCVAGAAALNRAHDYLRGHPEGYVLIVAVELPTLSFQHDDVSTAQLVSTALFGDGAAAALLTGRPRGPEPRGARILTTRSHLFPNSLEALGFELRDDGFHVLLAKDLPEKLGLELGRVVNEMLAGADLRRPDLTSFVLHPGGRKILASLEQALHIDRPQMQPSWDVLREYGNVSSAAVLFVLDRWLRRHRPPAQTYGLLGAFGPGLSAELCVLQWN
jgi:alkylresorcinol/alkylpyrone synthase